MINLEPIMKNLTSLFSLVGLLTSVGAMNCFGAMYFNQSDGLHSSSDGNNGNPVERDVFDNGRSSRDAIVIISDLHLGADMTYAEINKNLKSLENFLTKIQESENIRELVIAGDLLDEWFVPAEVNTYQGKDQRDFVQRVAANNPGVIDRLNRIIAEGEIQITYVPGNHDLTVTAENIELILPGMKQVRDQAQGLGTYSPTGYPSIAIEHGHRYNYFCAPDPLSNQEKAPGTILPPGYFFTRIAAEHVLQECQKSENVVPEITANASLLSDESQKNLYAYYKLWEVVLNQWFPIETPFSEKMIVTNVNGFMKPYSVLDILPYQKNTNGPIAVNLYSDAQDHWPERCALNGVAVAIPVNEAIKNAALAEQTDEMAKVQYFKNPDSNKKLVVFGHTHEARLIPSENLKGEKTVYVNSGTWIDHKPGHSNDTSMNFVIITPPSGEEEQETKVFLYNFQNEKFNKMASASVTL